MIYPVYCLRDTKVGFNPEFIIQMNEAAAVRGFKFMLDNAQSIPGKFPEDYELYQVGNFDSDSGVIDSIVPPKFIVSGGVISEK